MSLTMQFLYPNTLFRIQKPQSCTFPFLASTHFTERTKTQVPCTNRKISDADLASGLATEVAKMNTHVAQREVAMKKSKELLFIELCNFLVMEKEEVKRKWSKIDEEEKGVLLKDFVNEWGVNFHPLSIRSIREMIDEYLNEEKAAASSSSDLFPGLKRMMGFLPMSEFISW